MMNLRFEQPFSYTPRTRAQVLNGLGSLVTAEQYEITEVSAASVSIPPLDEFDVAIRFAGLEPFAATPATVADQDHPDDCSSSSLIGPDTVGAELILELESEVVRSFGPGCYDLTRTNSVDSWDATLTAIAPSEPGEHTLEARLVGANSGEVFDTATVEILVDEEAESPAEPPDLEPEDPFFEFLRGVIPGVPESESDIPFIGGGVSTAGVVALTVIIVLLLVVSLSN